MGIASYKNSPEVEYTLITYKNTPIVHNFFVSSNNKPFNKKKVLDLIQGFTSATYEFMTGMETFKFSYFDINSVERFKVVLRSNKYYNTDKWHVQVNSAKGFPQLTTRIKETERGSQLDTPFRITQIDFSNVTWIEKEIKKMLDGNYEY